MIISIWKKAVYKGRLATLSYLGFTIERSLQNENTGRMCGCVRLVVCAGPLMNGLKLGQLFLRSLPHSHFFRKAFPLLISCLCFYFYSCIPGPVLCPGTQEPESSVLSIQIHDPARSGSGLFLSLPVGVSLKPRCASSTLWPFSLLPRPPRPKKKAWLFTQLPSWLLLRLPVSLPWWFSQNKFNYPQVSVQVRFLTYLIIRLSSEGDLVLLSNTSHT